MRNKCESALPNANRDLKRKSGGGKRKAAPAVVIYNSVPRVGSSRGAERDPHLSSRTFKGSCTFRTERSDGGRGGEAGFSLAMSARRGDPPAAASSRVFIAVSPPPNRARRFPHAGGAYLPASPPLLGASPLLLFLSSARRSGEGARVRGGRRDLPASGTCSPGPVGRFSPGPARDYRPHMALRPGA